VLLVPAFLEYANGALAKQWDYRHVKLGGADSCKQEHFCFLRSFHFFGGLRKCADQAVETIELTDRQYPLYAASALAANSFARSSFAAAFPVYLKAVSPRESRG
jgi:hypothetical protein